jgi:hypothetical protein
MAELTRLLPPDAEQLELAKEVNGKLGGDSKVTFYRKLEADGQTAYGVVYQYGTARRVYEQPVPHHDVDEIVQDVERWIRRL